MSISIFFQTIFIGIVSYSYLELSIGSNSIYELKQLGIFNVIILFVIMYVCVVLILFMYGEEIFDIPIELTIPEDDVFSISEKVPEWETGKNFQYVQLPNGQLVLGERCN